MDLLLTALREHDSFRPERNCLLDIRLYVLEVRVSMLIYIRRNFYVASDACSYYVSVTHQTHLLYFGHWVKYLLLHIAVTVVKHVVSCIVEQHTDCREWNACLTKFLGHLDYR